MSHVSAVLRKVYDKALEHLQALNSRVEDTSERHPACVVNNSSFLNSKSSEPNEYKQ